MHHYTPASEEAGLLPKRGQVTSECFQSVALSSFLIAQLMQGTIIALLLGSSLASPRGEIGDLWHKSQGIPGGNPWERQERSGKAVHPIGLFYITSFNFHMTGESE